MAILPESVARANAEGLHAIEITHPRMRGRVALAWRSEGPIGPAAQALIRRARTVDAPVPARSAAIPEA
jgi:DNA-binding transcriptional LysR family regulator